ncbi:fibronectin type III domain-containing protein [Paenibacillus oceani]|uniref:Fibronectin type III domain-containing protein n=1 Tax=Paenibacillus oceani TaxID=2772510 RepID=A0A927C8I4_9BACL|nr:fibronectin type III domain-containing protein [Paenibacillus oceani]MBD2863369.1 fibronectin type III domain-containing protein [Paenibacillus oceani]
MWSRKAKYEMGKMCAASLVLFIVWTIALGIPAHAAETWSQYGRIGPKAGSDAGAFNSPIGMTTDSHGNIYVADSGNQRVQKLDKATGNWQTVSSNLGFNGPVGVTVDVAGNLYVSEFYGNRVQKLDASTNTWSSWTGFNKPYGIAVDSVGTVYVADSGNNRIQVLAAGGNVWNELAGSGSTSGKVKEPRGLAVDSHDNLYVADSGNNRIQKMSGGTWSQWGNGTSVGDLIGHFSAPFGVMVDQYGNVYVADTGNNRIQKLAAGGGWSEWKKTGGAVGTGLGEFNSPMGVTVDQEGTMYVADSNSHRVQKLAGTTWSEWVATGSSAGTGLGEFNKPYSLAVNGGGDLFVADLLNKRIQKLTASGTWSSFGTGVTFTNPAGVAIDKNGNLYVADMGNNYGGHKVYKLSAAGALLTSWGKSDTQSGTAPGQFKGAEGVAVDKDGNVYVADTGNHRIQKLQVSNNTWSAWGKSGNVSGTGLGEFNQPTGVAVDSEGNVYVGDTNNNRIQKFTVSTGEWSEWKNGGSALGTFSFPRQVTVDGSGNLYVADVGKSRILKLTAATNTWKAWGKSGGGQGSGLGEFFNPYGVAVADTSGVLYVADMNNHRVQKLVITIEKPGAPTGAAAAAGNGKATISFTPPADDGGSPITGYTVTSSPGGLVETGSASPITVTGLTNLTEYTFTVVATNAKGDSVPSAPTASVTPAAEPDAPTGGTATAGNAQAAVTFTPPASDGGSPITGYKVISSPGGKIGTGLTSTISVYGLTNGTAYTFTVVAMNAIGSSEASAPSESVTPIGEPGAPTGVTAVVLYGTALVSFTPPVNDGGSPITEYTVTSSPDGKTGTGATSPIAVTGLTVGTVYTFTVVATNAEGDSLPSAPSGSVTPTIPPAPAPLLQSAASGDGQVTLAWIPAPGATGYKIFQSLAFGTEGNEVTTVGAAVYGYTATGLTNGVTYYYVVKSVNAGGDSLASNQVSAVPQVPAPGAPVLQATEAGNGQVTLAWSPVPGSTGYKVFQSVTSGTYGSEVATVSGAVYGYTATGLTNGTAYYFVVKAAGPGGDSPASNQVSAIPVTVPAAPTDVIATEGDGEATVAFTPPADNGGSSVTGYEVTASPGNMTATGAASPIRVTGLQNGTTYTFTVKAINSVGGSLPSAPSNAVQPTPSPSDDDGGAGNGSGTPSVPTVPGSPDKSGTGVDVWINGKAEHIGAATTAIVNERTVTTVTVDPGKLEEKLAAQGEHAVIVIPVLADTDVAIGELNGQMVQSMERKQAVVEIKTDHAVYTLPARQINIRSISEQLGKNVALSDIKVRIEIGAPPADAVKAMQNAAGEESYTIVVPPLDFAVKAIYGNATVEVTRFDAYVERMIAIPDGVDPGKITTGVVADADGTVRHVPTKIVKVDGKYYAKINSLTNSAYSVIWNPLEFRDVAGHWAKDTVNDMGSRLIVGGIGDSLFNPDMDITRAEFAAILVKGLGLKPEKGTVPFPDVHAADWYSEAILTAYANKLISGFDDGTFRPTDKITREQAMVIIANAMKITGLKAKQTSQADGVLPGSFADAHRVAEWAASGVTDSLQAGIVTGRNDSLLAPEAFITRAEVVVMIRKLLQRSDLI